MNNVIEIINENEKKETVKVLKYLSLKSTGKKYVLYTDVNSSKDTKIYCAEAIINNDILYLQEISDDSVKKELGDYIRGMIKNG